MAVKYRNPRELDRIIEQKMQALNRAALVSLAKLGEKMVSYARLDNSKFRHYTDRTGNLRSSIGYSIVQNGKIVLGAFSGNTQPQPGYESEHRPEQAQAEGRAHAERVAATLDSTKTWLVFTAGKDYASYVEAKGFDVITGTFDYYSTSAEIEQLEKQFKEVFMTDVSDNVNTLKSAI